MQGVTCELNAETFRYSWEVGNEILWLLENSCYLRFGLDQV